MNVLVTGASSGLGRAIHERFGGSVWRRRTESVDGPSGPFDAIVHCAWNAARQLPLRSLVQYLDDTVGVTARLAAVPHRQFVFISSVDVYPAKMERCTEDSTFDVDGARGLYAMFKAVAESIVLDRVTHPLILRCTSLLGMHTRSSNTIVRLASEIAPRLTLTSESRLNVVTHVDVVEFVRVAIERGLEGIYNVASAQPISVGDVALLANRRPQFGDYYYDVGNIDNSKAASLFGPFRRTSADVVRDYVAARVAR